MPRTTIGEIPPAEQAHMLAEIRRARYGDLLAFHILPLCAAQRTPTEVAAVWWCSRSTVYRGVKAYRAGQLAGLAEEAEASQERAQRRLPALSPARKRAGRAILQAVPRVWGWCRTRGSCVTIALELQARRGRAVSGETVRRWLQELDWVWKRAKLSAKEDDPQWVAQLARIRFAFEQQRAGAALFFADEWESGLLPKVGYQCMPKGAQVEILTPGANEKRSLAGAWDATTGTISPRVWYSKVTGLFLNLLQTLDRAYPAATFLGLTVVADNAKSPHAEEVEKWVATPPRFELLSLPTYCPRANPIERAFGDVHDKGTRNHTRKRLWPLLQDVTEPLQVNGPWPYALSEIYSTPEVTAAMAALRATETAPEEISPLAA